MKKLKKISDFLAHKPKSLVKNTIFFQFWKGKFSPFPLWIRHWLYLISALIENVVIIIRIVCDCVMKLSNYSVVEVCECRYGGRSSTKICSDSTSFHLDNNWRKYSKSFLIPSFDYNYQVMWLKKHKISTHFAKKIQVRHFVVLWKTEKITRVSRTKN